MPSSSRGKVPAWLTCADPTALRSTALLPRPRRTYATGRGCSLGRVDCSCLEQHGFEVFDLCCISSGADLATVEPTPFKLG